MLLRLGDNKGTLTVVVGEQPLVGPQKLGDELFVQSIGGVRLPLASAREQRLGQAERLEDAPLDTLEVGPEVGLALTTEQGLHLDGEVGGHDSEVTRHREVELAVELRQIVPGGDPRLAHTQVGRRGTDLGVDQRGVETVGDGVHRRVEHLLLHDRTHRSHEQRDASAVEEIPLEPKLTHQHVRDGDEVLLAEVAHQLGVLVDESRELPRRVALGEDPADGVRQPHGEARLLHEGAAGHLDVVGVDQLVRLPHAQLLVERAEGECLTEGPVAHTDVDEEVLVVEPVLGEEKVGVELGQVIIAARQTGTQRGVLGVNIHARTHNRVRAVK